IGYRKGEYRDIEIHARVIPGGFCALASQKAGAGRAGPRGRTLVRPVALDRRRACAAPVRGAAAVRIEGGALGPGQAGESAAGGAPRGAVLPELADGGPEGGERLPVPLHGAAARGRWTGVGRGGEPSPEGGGQDEGEGGDEAVRS